MQVMEAPVRVLKGLAAGAGKIIGVADRRKAKAAAAAAAEPAAEAVAAQAPPAEPETSGNVKVVTPEPAAAKAEAAPEAEVAPESEAAPEAEAAPVAVVPETAAAEAAAEAAEAAAPAGEQPAPAKPAKAAAKKAPAKKDAKPAEAPADSGTAGAVASELPLANYDELTVNSLRARMTKLSPGQLTVLIEYEKAHQGREDIIGMFERRIIRINSGQTTSFQAVK